MIFEIIFVLSGLSIALLLIAKVWEGKTKRTFFLLRLISRGDERMRIASHEAANLYAMSKERGSFFVQKELPRQIKNFMMKTNTFVADRAEELIGNVRGTRFLKKHDNISDYFKSISEKEEGRIDDALEHPEKNDTIG